MQNDCQLVGRVNGELLFNEQGVLVSQDAMSSGGSCTMV